jgi:preprotein translocase subunit SecF
MFVVTYRKIFFGLSAFLVIVSLALLMIFNIQLSIDFTGGSVLEISYPQNRPAQAVVEQAVASTGVTSATIRQIGDQGFLIKTQSISNETKTSIIEALRSQTQDTLVEERFNTVGPTLGQKLMTQSIVAMLLVLIGITLYVSYAFRHVSKPVSSWKYGFVTIIALIHDIIITVGAFVILGQLYGTEVNTLFVTALLVILGYSVNDSIVVLDRVRENLAHQTEKDRVKDFDQTVGRSLKETIGRSLNTSFTTVLSLVALVMFGGEATRDFSLALIVGITVGTYSSIFLASPLLVSFFEHQKKQKKHVAEA